MALAVGPDGALYITMGNAGYNNAYWNDKEGVAHYSPDNAAAVSCESPDGKVEQLATGLRYIMSLQFNQQGDLFGTDQEGATWVPNGNPFDELLHLERAGTMAFRRGTRAGCRMSSMSRVSSITRRSTRAPAASGSTARRRAAAASGPSFGRTMRSSPANRAENSGAPSSRRPRRVMSRARSCSRGIGLMAVDCAISPQGDLVVCCHSGSPDWGNGPKGEGRIFKISYTGQGRAAARTDLARERNGNRHRLRPAGQSADWEICQAARRI